MINFAIDHKVILKPLTQTMPALKPTMPAFKGDLKHDVFTPALPGGEEVLSGVFDWDIFSVPAILRRNPELKQLAKEAIDGNVASYNQLIKDEKIALKKLEEVQTYVKTHLIDNCYEDPTPQIANAIVELGMVSDLTTKMVHSFSRIKSIKELPTMAKGLGWAQLYIDLKETVLTNRKVLKEVLDESNPKALEAHKDFIDALYSFFDVMDPDRTRNNTSKYAKIYALDVLKDKGNALKDIDVVIAIINNPEQLKEVRDKAAQILPQLIADDRIKEPFDKNAVQEKIDAALKGFD